MTDEIFELIAGISTPGFFITVEFKTVSETMPKGIEAFLQQKLADIKSGVIARKFAYNEEGWRLFFTFYPTDSVVEEKYAMKNQVVKSPLRFK